MSYGINDQLYLCTSEIMDKFVNIYKHISLIYEKKDELTSEVVAKKYAESNDIITEPYYQRSLMEQYAFDLGDSKKIYNGATKYITKWI